MTLGLDTHEERRLLCGRGVKRQCSVTTVAHSTSVLYAPLLLVLLYLAPATAHAVATPQELVAAASDAVPNITITNHLNLQVLQEGSACPNRSAIICPAFETVLIKGQCAELPSFASTLPVPIQQPQCHIIATHGISDVVFGVYTPWQFELLLESLYIQASPVARNLTLVAMGSAVYTIEVKLLNVVLAGTAAGTSRGIEIQHEAVMTSEDLTVTGFTHDRGPAIILDRASFNCGSGCTIRNNTDTSGASGAIVVIGPSGVLALDGSTISNNVPADIARNEDAVIVGDSIQGLNTVSLSDSPAVLPNAPEGPAPSAPVGPSGLWTSIIMWLVFIAALWAAWFLSRARTPKSAAYEQLNEAPPGRQGLQGAADPCC